MRRLVLSTVVVLLAWTLFSAIVVPHLISQAYRNESFSFLNDVISGRDMHPVEKYLSDWRMLAKRVGFGLLFFTPIAFAAVPWVIRTSRQRDYHHMSPQRFAIACVVILVVFVGSFIDIILSTEHWPFSNYPMYSNFSDVERANAIHVYLIQPDGSEYLAQDAFSPLDASRVNFSLARHRSKGTISEAGLELLKHYLRKKDAESIRGLRIYDCHWELSAWAENADDPERTMLYECFVEEAQ